MIRFLPDSLREAVLRPLAMAAPDGGVYVEIMAPDFRFVFILGLFAVLIFLWLWHKFDLLSAKPIGLLLLVTALAFIPWLDTTGNGRYFIPFLLAAGPLCLAGVFLLPMTKAFRLTMALCLVTVQAIVVTDANPLRSWALAQWQEPPYFQVDIPTDMATQPGTYLTISTISYSLIAPLFPAASRWMNLASAPSNSKESMEGRLASEFLASSGPLTLLAPAIPSLSMADGLPSLEVLRAMNVLLAEYPVEITEAKRCRWLRSNGLDSLMGRERGTVAKEQSQLHGFWACPLRYMPEKAGATAGNVGTHFDYVFEKVETLCPRFFQPGGAKTQLINGGELRQYGGSDMKLYVLNDGFVIYKYYRAYSPTLIGTVDEVMSGRAALDCGKIKGRSGLPWEREI